MARLVATLEEQFAMSRESERTILAMLEECPRA